MAVANTMDFFQSQEIARKKTSVLVVYYCLAVAMIILAVYVTTMVLFQGVMAKSGHTFAVKSLWNPVLFTYITAVTSFIVVIGTMYKISQLASGGATVAKMLGGQEVGQGTRDLNERKILNVVEEMAIASGVPVPPVFILEEDSINAFAAGFSPSDAVIGVTRGCVTQLNRDELQGVIAHEFSHILNGDMKLNIRLMGVLNGILVIGLIGYWIFRTTSNSESKKAVPIIVFGLVICAIGYIGVFFGKLIKSAVSRQREYLADASAVQFTRNPGGIAGALKRIGGYSCGSKISNHHAEEASHFFFCNGLAGSMADLMATHPPLEDRIKRLDPFFEMERSAQLGEVSHEAPPPLPEEGDGVAGISRFAVNPASVIASVGAPTSAHVVHAAGLIAGLPQEFIDAVHDVEGAKAVIFALLINKDESARGLQLKYLAGNAEASAYSMVLNLLPLVDRVGDECKLPLVDMAVPSLKHISESQYNNLKNQIQFLVEADKQVDLFEYALQRILLRHVESTFRKIKVSSVRYSSVGPVLPACGRLLSCLAYWGADEAGPAAMAFGKGMARLGAGTVEMSPVDSCGLPMVDQCLTEISAALPPVKKTILDACVSCIAADGYVTIEESELIRAIADSIDCPLPPFLPGKLN